MRPEFDEEFEQKKSLVDEWNRKAGTTLGRHAEDIYAVAFEEAGFYVSKRIRIHAGLLGESEVDILCQKRDGRPLSVEVKNILSEVIVDPKIIREPNELHLGIESHFETADKAGMVPVLIAPFVDRGFYVCCDRHRGLFCQTFLQVFPPGEEELCRRVKEELHFGNVRVAVEAPMNVRRWIAGVRERWRGRFEVRESRSGSG